MKKISIVFLVLFCLSSTFSQNSLLLNPNFESTTWPAIAWMTQTNTGAPIIVNENEPVFTSTNVTARSGSHFVYIGGGQNTKGKYEASLVQPFEIPYNGIGHVSFYYRYIRESVDPGSYIRILIDGNEAWSIAPHFIVDADENYVRVEINLGHMPAGTHTFELQGYEFPIGGDLPMQFVFDDINLQVASTAAVEQNNPNNMDVTINHGTIRLSTHQITEKDAVVEITDLSGKVIFTNTVAFANHITIQQPIVNAGIYLVSLKTNQQVFTKKVFLQ